MKHHKFRIKIYQNFILARENLDGSKSVTNEFIVTFREKMLDCYGKLWDKKKIPKPRNQITIIIYNHISPRAVCTIVRTIVK